MSGSKPKYKTEFCDQLISHMEKGMSFESFVVIAGVDKRTLYRWVEKYEEFREAKSMADAKCLTFFEKILAAKTSGQDIKGFDQKKSDTTLLIFALKTRFHKIYGDKANIEVKHSGSIGQEVDFSKFSKDELESFIKLAEKGKVEEE